MLLDDISEGYMKTFRTWENVMYRTHIAIIKLKVHEEIMKRAQTHHSGEWDAQPRNLTHTQTQRSLLSFNSLAIQISATFPAVFKWFLWDFSSQTSYSLFLSLSHHPHPSVAGVTGLGGPLLSADLWLPITQRGRLKREKIRHGIKNYGSVPTRTPLSSATRSSSQGWQLRLKPCECSRLHWEGGEWLNIFPHTVRPRGETHHQTIRNMFSGCGQTISHSLLQLSNINSCAFKQIDFPTH